MAICLLILKKFYYILVLLLLLVTTRPSYLTYSSENNVSIFLGSSLIILSFYPPEDNIL